MTWQATAEARRPALEAAWQRFAPLIDEEIGIIREVSDAPPLAGEPAFPGAGARLSRIDRLYGLTGFDEAAGATSLDPLEARIKACGEAIERYCGFLCFPDELVYTTAAELGPGALDPRRWPRCTEKEYLSRRNPLHPPDSNRSYHWVTGRSLTGGHSVWLPALHTYLTYDPADPAELTILPHSTGLAAGDSPAAAAFSAACEVLERDAVAVTWFKGLPAPKLHLEPSPWPEVAERLRRIRVAGLRAEAYALLPEEPPAKIFVLLWDRPGGPLPVMTGAGVALDSGRAIAKALDEAVQCRQTALQELILAPRPPRRARRPAEVVHLEDHLTFYLEPDHLEAFAFLTEQTETADPEALPRLEPTGSGAEAALTALVGALAERDRELLVADLTRRDVAAAGLHVVRAMIPGLVPLAHGHAMRFLGMERWQGLPGSIRPWPHPFG